MNERYTRLQRNSYIVIVGDWTSDPGLDFYVHSVHLLLVNKFGGIHKILAIKHYDSGCDGTRCPPEHHVCQGLRPCVTWKTESGCSESRTSLKMLWTFACMLQVSPSPPPPPPICWSARVPPQYQPGSAPGFFLLKRYFLLCDCCGCL